MGEPVTLYRYRAARADGRIASGQLHAMSRGTADAMLLRQGLHPLGLLEYAGPALRARPVPSRDLAIVFRCIASLIAAGVPLERAVVAAEGLARGRMRPMLADIRRQLQEGRRLASALGEYSALIPPVVLGMVLAGERGGQLETALDHAATHLEQTAELAASVRQALAYPLLLAVTGTISIGVIVTAVVPRFSALLTDTGLALPVTTRLLLGASTFAREYGLVVLVVAALLAFGLVVWLGRPAGALGADRLLLRLPLIGPIRHALATARVCRALGAMLQSGMPTFAAVEAAREAAVDRAVAERGVKARDRVARGEPLAASFETERLVTPLAAQLLSVGEASGRLAAMAEHAGTLSAREAERRIRTAFTLLEPALVVGFGAAVATVAMALLQAVYSVRPG